MTTDLEPCKHNDALGFLRENFLMLNILCYPLDFKFNE